MNNLLREIIANKRVEVAAAKKKVPESELITLAHGKSAARNFREALTSSSSVKVIAECKKQSPSKGVFIADYNPVLLAKRYEKGGAAALSVLTDYKYFGGTLDDLRSVKEQVKIPVLRKDFIVDRYQVFEARAAGADSFLLIAGTLEYSDLFKLVELGQSLGMEPLIESHTSEELMKAIEGPGKIYGVNNRNLSTFHVDLNIAAGLISQAKKKRPTITMVCESGVHSRSDVESMEAVGYKVFLIGEALVTSAEPDQALKALIGTPN
jgi:indole-3-glycerol phosphate synthase